MSTTSPIPHEYAALVDDAAVFPPGDAPLAEAVEAYRRCLTEPYATLLGPFVVSDLLLPDLIEILGRDEGAPAPLPVSVVVSGGAGGLEPAARWATGASTVDLRSLEVALRDPDDLAGNARRIAAAADLGLDVAVYVEPPPLPFDGTARRSWLAAADVVAEHDLRLKLRTGGVTADLVPSIAAVAAFLDAALDRELPFKCTAGLHRAVRHRDSTLGVDQHGFLNVLLATRSALDGGDVAAMLGLTDPEQVVATLAGHGSDALARTRRWFTSFGCCGVQDPLGDLRTLGLVGAA